MKPKDKIPYGMQISFVIPFEDEKARLFINRAGELKGVNQIHVNRSVDYCQVTVEFKSEEYPDKLTIQLKKLAKRIS